jgi:hypothetical protein
MRYTTRDRFLDVSCRDDERKIKARRRKLNLKKMKDWLRNMLAEQPNSLWYFGNSRSTIYSNERKENLVMSMETMY